MVTKDVFISHSAKDREVAQEICAVLEADGLSCWIAPRDVTPGKNFGEEILDAIEGTRATVLVLSEHSNASVHVRHEVERAVSKGRTVFPVRIQEVAPARALELFISSAQWIDAWTPPLEDGIARLADALRTLLASDPTAAAPTAPPPGSAPRIEVRPRRDTVAPARHATPEQSRGRGILVGAAVAALFVVAVGAFWWRSTRVSGPGIVLDVEEPRGAEILVDGRLVGQSSARPKRLALTTGEHRLKVQADGYWPYEQTIDVSGAEPEPLQVKLARTNTLAVAVTPADARIAVNGKVVDRPFPIELRDGRHTVDVSAPGYDPYRQVVELDGGRRESLVVTLNQAGKRTETARPPRREPPTIERAAAPHPETEHADVEPAARNEPAPDAHNPWADIVSEALKHGALPRPR